MRGFNRATPIIFHDDFSKHHLFVGFFGVGDGDINFQMFIGNASHWNGCKVIKVLIVIMDEVVIGFCTNYCKDSAE